MKIHAPSEPVFWSAVALLVLALIGHFSFGVPLASQYHFWIAIAAAVILVVDCIVPRETKRRRR